MKYKRANYTLGKFIVWQRFNIHSSIIDW
jgi:hypothetical protein